MIALATAVALSHNVLVEHRQAAGAAQFMIRERSRAGSLHSDVALGELAEAARRAAALAARGG